VRRVGDHRFSDEAGRDSAFDRNQRRDSSHKNSHAGEVGFLGYGPGVAHRYLHVAGIAVSDHSGAGAWPWIGNWRAVVRKNAW